MRAEDDYKKQQKELESSMADAETAFDIRQKAEDSLAQKTLELTQVNEKLEKSNSATSLAQNKLETETKAKLEAVLNVKGILEKSL